MKKLFFFLFLAIVLASCEGCDPINPPEPPPVVKIKQFTITAIVKGGHGTITPSSAIVDSLGRVTLTIKPDLGYIIDTLKDGDNVLPPTDVFTYRDISKNETLEASFKFKYEEGTPEWYFTQFVWVESRWLLSDGVYWYDFTDDSLKSTFWYNPDGTCDQEWRGTVYHGATWSLDKSTNPITLIATGRYLSKVEYLDSTKMVLTYVKDTGFTVQITYTNNGVRRFN